MSIISRLRLLYLCHFSKPFANRLIYRAIRLHKPRKIVELGIADGSRAIRLIEVAWRASTQSDVHYVGMDSFEGRPAADGHGGLSLKAAHQLLRVTGARVQLVPGNPSDSLIRLANSLGKVDLLIVPVELDSPSFARFWSFLPRMLHEGSLVFVEEVRDNAEAVLLLKPRHEIDHLAAAGVGRRAA